MADDSRIGSKLTTLRESLGLSTEELAERCDCDAGTIERLALALDTRGRGVHPRARRLDRSRGSDITESDLQEFARARIARYKAPKYVLFIDEYPMTVSGKIQKHTLRDLAAETLGFADVKVFASPAERPDPDATDDECAVRDTGGS